MAVVSALLAVVVPVSAFFSGNWRGSAAAAVAAAACLSGALGALTVSDYFRGPNLVLLSLGLGMAVCGSDYRLDWPSPLKFREAP